MRPDVESDSNFYPSTFGGSDLPLAKNVKHAPVDEKIPMLAQFAEESVRV